MKSSEAFIRLTSFIFPKKEARCNIFVLQLSICQMQGKFYSVNGALSVFYVWIFATLRICQVVISVYLGFLQVSCDSVVNISLFGADFMSKSLNFTKLCLLRCHIKQKRSVTSHRVELTLVRWSFWAILTRQGQLL